LFGIGVLEKFWGFKTCLPNNCRIILKRKIPKLLINNSKGILSAERQGFEPWQRLRVDRLAICSITTLAPLQNWNSKVIVPSKVNNLFFDIIQDTQSEVDIRSLAS
jgi:hypothetical protein